MLQDIGMLRVPEEIRLAPRVLDESERRVIEQHPIHTVDMLETMRKVPNSVKYVCYQSHERYDGSGYPRSQWGDKLHIFSQIVAIADVYVAMTNDRPHRQAKKPYDAVRAILMDASANRYNKELVRAFLDAISLFPIGSMVQLNDGRQAKVLRSNPGKHTRPVVELLGPDGEELSGSVIDLVHENKLSVASPL
jgi:HD-GYP domain-containing protein (c-di-GMP phosphodiesterase class II)